MEPTSITSSEMVAPPPFHKQRSLSVVLLAGLLAMIGITVVAGLVLTVPTHAIGTAVALHGGRTLVLLDPELAGRVPVGTRVQLHLAGPTDDTVVELARIEGVMDGAETAGRIGFSPAAIHKLPGPWLAAVADGPHDGPEPGTTGVAVAEIGRRPLIALFLGQGLEA